MVLSLFAEYFVYLRRMCILFLFGGVFCSGLLGWISWYCYSKLLLSSMMFILVFLKIVKCFEVSNHYCWISLFCFMSFCLMYFVVLLLSVWIFVIGVSFWWINPFINEMSHIISIFVCFKVYCVWYWYTAFVLRLVFAWYTFFHLFTLNLFLSIQIVSLRAFSWILSWQFELLYNKVP